MKALVPALQRGNAGDDAIASRGKAAGVREREPGTSPHPIPSSECSQPAPSSPLKKRLLQLLTDREFHSGNDLAAHLGISRSAVWKILQELNARGMELAAVPGRGYRVTRPLELLDAEAILADVSMEARALLTRLELHDELDSTNSRLLRTAAEGAPAGTVCLADTQTAGRGRIGREWCSPFGANLYLSLLWRFDDPLQATGLSLAVGVATVRALERSGITGVGLKWPNDLLWRERKLGGILLEVTGEAHGGCAVVLGLGVNRYLPARWSRQIGQPWIDLHGIAGERLPGRNALIAGLLNELLPLLRDYARFGLRHWLPEWRRHHAWQDREAVIEQGQVRMHGRIAGVADSGCLLLRCADGQIREFASGDVRLRTVAD